MAQKCRKHEKGTIEYQHEKLKRVEKSVSKKTPVAKFTSIMRKLDNQLAKEKSERKAAKERKGNSKLKTA